MTRLSEKRVRELLKSQGKPLPQSAQKPLRDTREPQREKESELVRAIVEGLRYKGRIVLRVGQWRADYAGTDTGCPDLFVWCPARQGWIGLEVKTAIGKVRPEQQHLADCGLSHIVRSVEEAFEAAGERL